MRDVLEAASSFPELLQRFAVAVRVSHGDGALSGMV